MKNKSTTRVCLAGFVLSLALSPVLAAVPASTGDADLQAQKLTYTLGQQALGGTIIYVNAAGNHGLVAANTDQGRDTLWMAFNDVTNPANFDNSGQVYTDWHLPSKYELTVMCNNIRLFPAGAAPVADDYWSATLSSQHYQSGSVNSNAYMMHMNRCESDVYGTAVGIRVRAVRSF